MDPSHSQRWNTIVEEGLKDRHGYDVHVPLLAPPANNHNIPPPSGQTPVPGIPRSARKTTTAPVTGRAKKSRKHTAISEDGPEPKKTKMGGRKEQGGPIVNSDDEYSAFLS